MSWRHHIAIVVLTAFAGLPVAGTVCSMVCDATATAVVGHHASGQACEGPAESTTDVQIANAAAHDCGTHNAPVLQVTATAGGRADLWATSAPVITSAFHFTKELPAIAPSVFNYILPPDTATASTTPVVLRV